MTQTSNDTKKVEAQMKILPDPKSKIWRLDEVATDWACSIDDLICYSKEDGLQICKYREEEEVFPYCTNPIPHDKPEPIEYEEVKKIYQKDQEIEGVCNLILTLEEKENFENKNKISRLSDQTEECIGEPGEKPLVGWVQIAPVLGYTMSKDGKKPKAISKHFEPGKIPMTTRPGSNSVPVVYLSDIKKYLAKTKI